MKILSLFVGLVVGVAAVFGADQPRVGLTEIVKARDGKGTNITQYLVNGVNWLFRDIDNSVDLMEYDQGTDQILNLRPAGGLNVSSGITAGNDVTSVADISARLGAVSQTRIGNEGPAGQAGISLGLAGDTLIWRDSAGEVGTSNLAVNGYVRIKNTNGLTEAVYHFIEGRRISGSSVWATPDYAEGYLQWAVGTDAAVRLVAGDNNRLEFIGGEIRLGGELGTIVSNSLQVIPLTTNKIAVLSANGTIVNALGTPDGTKFLRDDGTLATPSVMSGSGPTVLELKDSAGFIYAYSYGTNGTLVFTNAGGRFITISTNTITTSAGYMVGLGTGSPTNMLDVRGPINTMGHTNVGNSKITGTLTVNGAGTVEGTLNVAQQANDTVASLRNISDSDSGVTWNGTGLTKVGLTVNGLNQLGVNDIGAFTRLGNTFNASTQSLGGLMLSVTNSVTITNTATEGTLLGVSFWGATNNVSTAFHTNGRVTVMKFSGITSAPLTPDSLTFRVYCGSNSVAFPDASSTLLANAENTPFDGEVTLIQTTSTNLFVSGKINFAQAAGTADKQVRVRSNVMVVNNGALNLTAKWGAATVAQSITLDPTALIEVKR